MVPAWLTEHGPKLAVAAAGLLVLVPSVDGIVGGPDATYVTVEASESSDSVTVFAGKERGLLGGCPDQAQVQLRQDDFVVYPGVLGKIELDDCRGQIDIPYRSFASVNGPYQAKVQIGDETLETGFTIEKVVNWVYVRSFPNETAERTRIEVALAQTQAQPIRSSVFTSGELVLDVWWESCEQQGPLGTGLGLDNQTQDCQANHDNVFHGAVPLNNTAVTNVIVPWDNLESEKYEENRPAEGSYNVTATFHNLEAKGNKNVPMDPSVFREDPPGNWFEVDYE
jgi:hypothetical protein